MKKSYLTGAMVLVTLALFGAHAVPAEEHFSVKEYNQFHDVLHALQHEALPAKDFKRIRTSAAELVKRGNAIVSLGVPKGTAPGKAEEFRRELKQFSEAIGKFSDHSKNGTDEQLEVSFSAVHDSFEMLAGMLPQKSSN